MVSSTMKNDVKILLLFPISKHLSLIFENIQTNFIFCSVEFYAVGFWYMKNGDSTEGKLNVMMRTNVNKRSDVWPKNIFPLFLSSPVKKWCSSSLQVNWKNPFISVQFKPFQGSENPSQALLGGALYAPTGPAPNSRRRAADVTPDANAEHVEKNSQAFDSFSTKQIQACVWMCLRINNLPLLCLYVQIQML